MKSQNAITVALSGKHRYMILDALAKRVDTLRYRLEQKPGRKDLERIKTEMAELQELIGDDVKVHVNNTERLGQEMALLLAWPSNS